MNYLIAVMAVLLALSAAGNAWQFKHGEAAIEAAATATQMNTDTKAAATACSSSVDALGKAGDKRQTDLLAALKGVAPRVAALQAESLKAMGAKPDDPKDLCGSLERYLRGQIKSEKGASK